MTAFTLTSGGVTLAVSPCGRITRGRKIWSNAPDFRSPILESSVPQNNNDLAAEKGPACDARHRFALSAVYDIPAWDRSRPGACCQPRLASVHRLPGADRFPFYDFSVRRYC